MNHPTVTDPPVSPSEVTVVLGGRHRYGQTASFPDWAAAERAEQKLEGATYMRALYGPRRRLFSRGRVTRRSAR